MADQKISELTNITGANLADADEFVVVDVSADQTKAVTRAEFFKDTPAIGIGTGSPSAALDVVGNAEINGTLTVQGSTGSLFLTDTDVSETSRIFQTGSNLYVSNQTTTGSTIFTTDAGKNRQRIRSNGDVSFYDTAGTSEDFYWDASTSRLGLGTTNPSAALDVVGDIEVSGGIYLGGTGAANKLDDYEEGTWTPTGTYTTLSNNAGTYTKIGRMVYIQFFIDFAAAPETSLLISGLPFPARGGLGTSSVGATGVAYGDSSLSFVWATDGTTNIRIHSARVIEGTWGTNDNVRGSLTYRTD